MCLNYSRNLSIISFINSHSCAYTFLFYAGAEVKYSQSLLNKQKPSKPTFCSPKHQTIFSTSLRPNDTRVFHPVSRFWYRSCIKRSVGRQQKSQTVLENSIRNRERGNVFHKLFPSSSSSFETITAQLPLLPLTVCTQFIQLKIGHEFKI